MSQHFYDYVSKITDDIFIGSAYSVDASSILGVKSALVCCHDTYSDYQWMEEAKHVVFEDRVIVPYDVWEKAYRALDELISNHAPVLVHCTAGISRSPTVVAVWMVKKGMARDIDDAYEKIAQKRNIIAPHIYTRSSAKRYLDGVK